MWIPPQPIFPSIPGGASKALDDLFLLVHLCFFLMVLFCLPLYLPALPSSCPCLHPSPNPAALGLGPVGGQEWKSPLPSMELEPSDRVLLGSFMGLCPDPEQVGRVHAPGGQRWQRSWLSCPLTCTTTTRVTHPLSPSPCRNLSPVLIFSTHLPAPFTCWYIHFNQ